MLEGIIQKQYVIKILNEKEIGDKEKEEKCEKRQVKKIEK